MNVNAPVNPENRAICSVFIGNIQYDVTEEQLKGLFSEVGPIVNFRILSDKSLNKSKIAFCEYKDPEIAIRAVRNLNAFEFKGQPLNVDVATSEKCRQELERLQGSIEAAAEVSDSATDKAPEEISKAVASLPAEQMFELMKQMKMCIENNPQEARNLLLQNPQLAYALLQAQVIMRIVDPKVAVQILNRPIVPATTLNPETKSEPIPQAAPPISEGPPAFLPGMVPVASDPLTTNVPAPVPVPVPVPRPGPGPVPPSAIRPTGIPMMSVPTTAPGIPNQFADQDLRTLGDQDLRVLPNLTDRDMRVPPAMLGIDKDMRQPMGDQDFRTLAMPAPVPENRPFDPRFRNMQGSDRTAAIPGIERARPANLDPRTPYDPRAGAASRVEDPRKASLSAALNSRLSAAGPALQNLGRNMPNIGGPNMGLGVVPDEQEKAALIMQVLQLTDQQIAMLSPEQRQSIMVLKEQLARSQLA